MGSTLHVTPTCQLPERPYRVRGPYAGGSVRRGGGEQPTVGAGRDVPHGQLVTLERRERLTPLDAPQADLLDG